MCSSRTSGLENTNIFFESDLITVLSARTDAVIAKIERWRTNQAGEHTHRFSFVREIGQAEFSAAMANDDLSQLPAGTRVHRANGYCYVF